MKKNNIDIKTTEEEDTISRNDKYNSSSSFPENNLLHKAVFEGILGLEEQNAALLSFPRSPSSLAVCWSAAN